MRKTQPTITYLFRLLTAVIASTAFASLCCAASVPTPAEIEARFAKVLRNAKVSSVRKSPIPGLYEAISGPNVFYVAPGGKGFLLFGQIVDAGGANLTAAAGRLAREEYDKKREQAAAEKLKNIKLDLAVKVCNGPNTVIEFTDPDCPYCRQMDRFLSQRSDVTRYVFLHPLDQLHPNARAKSVYILSSKDGAAALKEVFSGKYDKEPLPITFADLPKYPNATQRLVDCMETARELGIEATPMLFVNGRIVQGADTEKVDRLLKK